ncbi:hypothetical protein NEUTE1DRAFT_104313 [Neurospora tetrasperma FGSC 2508]|uniref:C2H2-type domain-containing protein n=1 Tax=Neurospora tetrasperma (strain FGSC 2508 / ATCC MYA-4615 / P0657) TaxID=510951 RepID=F8MWB5_NEUT8|nr:uncharacterized protein NEUTE1DRAFT_104313 [Neurospora tetrasperma FGSC 2508]EGO54910.1 hypothetical protein NEUTE1DRAFT_104313 [Neurospora tetrasperma FGSC 2508]EGZ67598.1 hypothetical protein NEUTE2DRAFT_73036 [Neurospora tetrasperma FGSC 2509]
MDFFDHLQGFCPVHFLVNANDMTFSNNKVDQAQWGCPCPEYSGYGNGALNNAGGLVLAGPSAENNMVVAEHCLVQAPGVIPANLHYPDRNESLGSASDEPAASQAHNSKLFTCDHCGSISAKTSRDFKRHLQTEKHRKNASRSGPGEFQVEWSPNRGTEFRCPVPPCNKTFPRKDNLWRHIAKMHRISDEDE